MYFLSQNLNSFLTCVVLYAATLLVVPNAIISRDEWSLTSLVTVLAVAYNDTEDVGKFLCSLKTQTYRNTDLVLVDNSKSDLIRDLVVQFKSESRLRNVHYVGNENTGYTGGVMLGAKFARGDLILVCNPDTILERNCIETLVSSFSSQPANVMILAPKVMIRDSDVINSIGMRRMRPNENLYVNIGYLEEDRGQYDLARNLIAFDGAAFMFRSELLKHTYLFDPKFFFGDDTPDLAERVLKLGFQIRSCPSAVIRHEIRGSVANTKLNDELNAILVRNALIHTLRNMGWGMFLRTLIIAIWYRNILRPVIGHHKNWRWSFTYAKGTAKFLLDIGRFF